MISAKKRDLQQQMEQAQQGGQAGPGQEELRKLENTLTGLEQSRERQERRIQVGLGWLSGAVAGRASCLQQEPCLCQCSWWHFVTVIVFSPDTLPEGLL